MAAAAPAGGDDGDPDGRRLRGVRADAGGGGLTGPRWAPPPAAGLPALLAGFARPWWVAGGVAVELFCGAPFRGHGDLDVEVLRPDAAELVAALPGWELHDATGDGGLVRWRGDVPPVGNSLWSRPGPDRPWAVQFMLAHTAGPDRWVYRRDHRVGRSVGGLGWRNAVGLPVLRPEVELLYKARAQRPRDDLDLDHVLPLMDPDAVAWLAAAVATAHPASPWLPRLTGT